MQSLRYVWSSPDDARVLLGTLNPMLKGDTPPEASPDTIQHCAATQTALRHPNRKPPRVTKLDTLLGVKSSQDALKRGGKEISNQPHRAQSIGAEVNWDSSGAGTCFTLRLPIKRGSE